MTLARLVLGCLLVTVGAGMILARARIAARHRGAGRWQAGSPVLWAVIGGLFVVSGVLQLLRLL
jgi:hypothetical protein